MKEVRHSVDSNVVGSSFQTVGATTEKACLPRFRLSSGNEKAAVM